MKDKDTKVNEFLKVFDQDTFHKPVPPPSIPLLMPREVYKELLLKDQPKFHQIIEGISCQISLFLLGFDLCKDSAEEWFLHLFKDQEAWGDSFWESLIPGFQENFPDRLDLEVSRIHQQFPHVLRK